MNSTEPIDRLLAATAAEEKVAEFARLGDDLLPKIEAADVTTAELLRSEATRLFSVCHEITRLLALGDIEGEHRIGAGDADQNGEVWSVAV